MKVGDKVKTLVDVEITSGILNAGSEGTVIKLDLADDLPICVSFGPKRVYWFAGQELEILP